MSPSPQPAQQARSVETVERLLIAAEEVFVERGLAGFNVQEVSRRANVSIATIYKRFENKQGVLAAVLRRVGKLEDESIFDAWETEDWRKLECRQMIERLVHDLSHVWRERAPLMRAVMSLRLQMQDSQVMKDGLGLMAHREPMFRAAVLTHADEIIHPSPDEAIDFAFRLILSLSGRWAARTIETISPHQMSWDTMLANATDTITIYLFGHRASHPGRV